MQKKQKRVGQQNKRFQSDVYKYLTDKGESTAVEITDWYNNRDLKYNLRSKRVKHTGAKNTLSSGRAAGILSTSILFEKVGSTRQVYLANKSAVVALWNIRPMNDILDRAIKSRKAPERFPKFIADEIRKRLQDE